MLGADSFLVD